MRISLWRGIAHHLQHPAGNLAARRSEAMAHRRHLIKGRVGLAAMVLLGVGVVLAGSVFVSNQTVRLRRSIAALEADVVVARAENANLHARWNVATAPRAITGRAERELGLIVPADPSPVLAAVRLETPSTLDGVWRLLQGLGGGEPAQAAVVSGTPAAGKLVSLAPRGVALAMVRP